MSEIDIQDLSPKEDCSALDATTTPPNSPNTHLQEVQRRLRITHACYEQEFGLVSATTSQDGPHRTTGDIGCLHANTVTTIYYEPTRLC